jgi:hypothetical protein
MAEDAVMKHGAEEDEQVIKPQALVPAVDTSDWPLLLKNYDKRRDPPLAGLRLYGRLLTQLAQF